MSTHWRCLLPVVGLIAFIACEDAPTEPATTSIADVALAKGGDPGPPGGVGEETSGTNLSFPTIWAAGVTKSPRGTMGTVDLGGPWWYWWGEPLVEGGDPLACAPDADDASKCDDGVDGQATGQAPGGGWVRAYLQKDAANEWQADNANAAVPVQVDRIDWGDAIESVAWTLKSKVRVETTMFEDVIASMTGYTMRHVYGHGIDEMWAVDGGSGGSAVALEYESTEAIVYSPCARLTIQKLLVPRELLEPLDPSLTWNATAHVWENAVAGEDVIDPSAVINSPIAAEGPGGGFGAEINIQGKIVYGFTWDVKSANDGAGDYRITFSLADDNCPTSTLNTHITADTEIIPLAPEGEITIASESSEGGVAVIDGADNLTYIDIRIDLKTTGGGGGGGGGGGNGGGGNSGGAGGGGGGGGGGHNGPR